MNAGTPAARPILLVEDDAATAELERRILVRDGRAVRTTDRAQEAVSILQKEPILAVILDYRLKDGQAWPVLEAAQAVRPRVPVIVVTAMGDERVAAEAIHRGATDYLIKSGDFSSQLPPAVERALRIAEAEHVNARLASIVEYSQDAIIGATLDGLLLSWNRGAQKIFGLAESEAVGTSVARLFDPEGRASYSGLQEQGRHGGEPASFETTGTSKDGRRIDLRVSLSVIRDPEGKPDGLSIIIRDITDLKRMQEVVLRTQSLAAMGEMAATVAHEVKNPLAAISGPLQILSDDLKPGDSRKELMQEIIGQVRRLDATVRGLLAFAKPYVPRKQILVLRELVDRVARLMADHGSGKGIRITVEQGEGLSLAADPVLLEQVLWNLFLNAAESMKSGGVIRAILRDVPGALEAQITDSGSGIPAEILPRIFDPFVTTKSSGTGLGLPLCRKIIQAHGGTIEISSTVGQGTTVLIRLPRT